MRKALAIAMAMILVIIGFSAVPVTAHPWYDPLTIDLIAGGGNPKSQMDAGDILVWNDGEYLYVQYTTTEPWLITATHLHVAASPGEIPQTKNNNPKPGHFTYNDEWDYVDSVTYQISLNGWVIGTDLYIAAHAVVVKPVDDCCETVWQIGDVEVVNAEMGWLENYADEFNWGDPAGPTTAGPTLAVEQPAYTDPFIVGTTPTDQFPFNSNYNRNYARNFDIKWTGGLPFGGKLTISWSPGQSAFEKKIVTGDGLAENVLTATGTPRPDEGWFLDKYSLVENQMVVGALANEEHTINIQHTQGDGTFYDWIRLEKPCEQDETAWGSGDRFNDKNWATYIEYTVQDYICPIILVPPEDPTQTISAQTLMSDIFGNLDLSGTVWLYVTYPSTGGAAYFPHIYIDVDGDWDPDYDFPGWCLDTDHTIFQNRWYEMNVLTCEDQIPTYYVDRPWNLHYVYHILNQHWVGRTSPSCSGTYTYGDVQRAIWTVIEDHQSTNGLDDWSQCRVNEILSDAEYPM